MTDIRLFIFRIVMLLYNNNNNNDNICKILLVSKIVSVYILIL